VVPNIQITPEAREYIMAKTDTITLQVELCHS